MSKIEEVIRKQSGVIFYKPVEKQAIFEAEKRLGLKFNNQYKEYVKMFGSISYVGHELTGVTNCPEDDVVQLTDEIKKINPSIPSDWYVLENTGIDGIVIWQDESGKIYRGMNKIYDSLIEYIGNDKSNGNY